MVFTIDVSGSQSGIPLAQEKAAVKYALSTWDRRILSSGAVRQLGIKLFAAPCQQMRRT